MLLSLVVAAAASLDRQVPPRAQRPLRRRLELRNAVTPTLHLDLAEANAGEATLRIGTHFRALRAGWSLAAGFRN